MRGGEVGLGPLALMRAESHRLRHPPPLSFPRFLPRERTPEGVRAADASLDSWHTNGFLEMYSPRRQELAQQARDEGCAPELSSYVNAVVDGLAVVMPTPLCSRVDRQRGAPVTSTPTAGIGVQVYRRVVRAVP
jgi:hypothetical protein